jgi:hypothetical protein
LQVKRVVVVCLVGAVVAACSPATAPGPDAKTARGCPVLEDPLAQPGDPIDGDNFANFAGPFFASFCTRCHGSTVMGADRNGAPEALNWDSEVTVRSNLSRIRLAVGVGNFMPPSDPKPSCAERERLVRWIDADAP